MSVGGMDTDQVCFCTVSLLTSFSFRHTSRSSNDSAVSSIPQIKIHLMMQFEHRCLSEKWTSIKFVSALMPFSFHHSDFCLGDAIALDGTVQSEPANQGLLDDDFVTEPSKVPSH